MDPIQAFQGPVKWGIPPADGRPARASIPGLKPLDPETAPRTEGPAPDGPDFGKMLADGIQEVSDAQMNVRRKMEGLLTGETKGIHEVMEAMGRSEVAFQLMLEVRNRLIEAWKEITRIQV